ncbi:MAG: AAA family ATPase, partial [Vulcanococcus sp.]
MPTSGRVEASSLSHLAVAGYRSLQNLSLPLGALTLVSGANGSGKSNLYRALALVAAAARGDLVAALAAEGGLPAVFWAGPQRGREPARLRLGFRGETLSYAIELGYRGDDERSAFVLD